MLIWFLESKMKESPMEKFFGTHESLKNEFKVADGWAPSVPEKSGLILTKGNNKAAKTSPVMAANHQSGSGKLMHVMKFSRQET